MLSHWCSQVGLIFLKALPLVRFSITTTKHAIMSAPPNSVMILSHPLAANNNERMKFLQEYLIKCRKCKIRAGDGEEMVLLER